MSLARAERRRLFKRRLTRYMLLAAVGVLATIAIVTFFNNQKIGPAQAAAAARAADRAYQQEAQFMQQERQACEQAKAAGNSTDGRFPMDCAQIVAPPREAFPSEAYTPATFDFREEFEPSITIFAGILAMFAFVVGASYVGAEWHSGGMMNLLLWRPRRLPVLLTKLGMLLGGLAGIFVGLGAAWTAAFWGIATFRGSTDRMTSGVWQSLALTGLRGLGLVIAAGVIGFGIASLGRHTALAMGAAVGIGVVGQIGVGIALHLIDVQFVERWVWPSYLQAWMDKRLVLQDFSSCNFSLTGECRPQEYVVTWQQSAGLFSAAVVVVLAAALWAMRRRDIT